MSPSLIIYLILTAWETFLFATQRAALEFSRDMNVSRTVGNLMLPLWYGTTWPTKILRWVALYFVYLSYGIWVALILLALPFLMNMFVPIPYKFLLPQFEKVLLRDISRGKITPQINLYTNLQAIREKVGLPKKTTNDPPSIGNT